jgi:hypothetical protein
MTFLQMHRTPWRLVSAAATWPVSSQQHARRNALASTTALARRRQEVLEVERYLAAHQAATFAAQHSA